MKLAGIALACAALLAVAPAISARQLLQSAPAPAPQASFASISDWVAAAAPTNFTILQAALNVTDLTQMFADPSVAVTFFAPTDVAWTAYIASINFTEAELLGNNLLATHLYYHLVPSVIPVADFQNGESLATLLEGQNITLSSPTSSASAFTLNTPENSANILPNHDNIVAGQSLVQVIDAVLALPLSTLIDGQESSTGVPHVSGSTTTVAG